MGTPGGFAPHSAPATRPATPSLPPSGTSGPAPFPPPPVASLAPSRSASPNPPAMLRCQRGRGRSPRRWQGGLVGPEGWQAPHAPHAPQSLTSGRLARSLSVPAGAPAETAPRWEPGTGGCRRPSPVVAIDFVHQQSEPRILPLPQAGCGDSLGFGLGGLSVSGGFHRGGLAAPAQRGDPRPN